jgi:hypothetical protein
MEDEMAEESAIQISDSGRPSDEEVDKELAKKPGDSLEPTPAGAEAANERFEAAKEQASEVGTDKDPLAMETKLIDKVVGHD